MKKIICWFLCFFLINSAIASENQSPKISPYQLYFMLKEYGKLCFGFMFYANECQKIKNSKIFCKTCQHCQTAESLWATLAVSADEMNLSTFMRLVYFGSQQDVDLFFLDWYEKNKVVCSICPEYQGWVSSENCVAE